jgi:hypothetical protein
LRMIVGEAFDKYEGDRQRLLRMKGRRVLVD